MSATPRQLAFAIKDRIEEDPEWKGRVYIDQAPDITSSLNEAMMKGRGKAAVIRIGDTKNISKDVLKYRASTSFTVAVCLNPVLNAKMAKKVDELENDLSTRLHGWWPDSIPSNGLFRCIVEGASYPVNAATPFAISLISIKAPGQF